MKIIWFTNIPMPAMDESSGITTQGSGSWMMALLTALSNVPNLNLAVVAAYPGRKTIEFSKNGIDYFVIGQPPKSWRQDFRGIDLDACQHIVERWQPDVIHIHGSERFYGLLRARNLVTCPTVISIQGFINPYAKWLNFFGELPFIEILKTHGIRELLLRAGLLADYFSFKKRAKQELGIIKGNQFFIGRTAWDRSHLQAMNSSAKYFHVDEMMRDAFFKREWRLEVCQRHTIIFTNSGHPRRGTEVLLEAITLLVSEFPNIQLKLAGHLSPKSGYGRLLLRKIDDLNLRNQVGFLGYLDADQMAIELANAHVFAIASYIENSPNSLCEAMLLGMPCVASYTGGIPSLITENKDGLFFPIGDAASLADRIRQIFNDDALAERLGHLARKRAVVRHQKDTIIKQLVTTYQEVSSHK